MSRAGMQQALDALRDIQTATNLKRLFRDADGVRMDEIVDEATEALRAELAKPALRRQEINHEHSAYCARSG